MSARAGRPLTQGQVLWTPPADARRAVRARPLPGVAAYASAVSTSRRTRSSGTGRSPISRASGRSIWDFFEIRAHAPYERVLGSREMPGAEWFPGARLNFAEHMVGRDEDLDAVAVVAHSQSREPRELTFGDLREQVARARAGLQRLGVGPGDRVVAYLPNIPETLVAFLATASLGAIWATCPPEFGVRSVLHRLGQLEPKVIFAVAGYRYGDKHVDRREQVAEIREGLPSLEAVVHVPYAGGADDALPDAVSLGRARAPSSEPLAFEPLPFAHPLYVLFSSGTTGLPKAIVHCHGGILVEHLKNHGFSWDLRPGDRLQWFTTTAWMMWNALVSVAAPPRVDRDDRRQPRLPRPLVPVGARRGDEADASSALSPAFTMACRKEGLEPGRLFDLSSVRMVCEAGLAAAPRGLRVALRAVRPGRLPERRQRRHRRLHGDRAGLPAAPRLRRRDVGRCLGVDVGRVRAGREARRRRARRARHQAADAVDAGRVSGTTPTARATAPRTSTTSPASGASATGSCSPSAGAR